MTMDYDYEYLGWGTKVDPEDIQKKADYSELEKMDFLRTDRESIVYEEKEEESNEYNVWFFEGDTGKPWGEGDEGRKQRREAAKVQIRDFVREVGPDAEKWEWRGGSFLDAFLLEENITCEQSDYDSVLLLVPDSPDVCTLAIVWEMVPEDKRYLLMNLQKAGRKIFASFSDRFIYPEDHFVCVEVYIKNN